MTTSKQIVSNQRKAKLSTGPRTGSGRAIVSRNALRHGILSQEVLLTGEDEARLKSFRDRIHAELRPLGEVEELLVDRIIVSACQGPAGVRSSGRQTVSPARWGVLRLSALSRSYLPEL